MPVVLNHTIVPSHDKEGSARFFARIMGVNYAGAMGHFAQVRVNDDLALDYDNRENFDGHHYAFVVDDKEFDEIFGRLKDEGVRYGSGPGSSTDGQINTRRGGRGLYFGDPDGHLMEIMTVPE
jgi:catechol 2,3-dioxygenase-like lactoylglutathione lyase family enzyme